MVLQSGHVFPTSDHCRMQRKQKEFAVGVKGVGNDVSSVAQPAVRAFACTLC